MVFTFDFLDPRPWVRGQGQGPGQVRNVGPVMLTHYILGITW